MRLGIYLRTIETARGAEQVTAILAKRLADRGHSVDFLVERVAGSLLEELDSYSDRIQVVGLRSQRVPPWLEGIHQLRALARNLIAGPASLEGLSESCTWPLLRTVLREKPTIFALHSYVKRRRPDAVISFLNYPNVFLLLTALLDRSATRYVVNVRNHTSTKARNAKNSKRMRNAPRLMRRLFRYADAIVTPSKGVAEDVVHITRLPQDRVTTIYNPVYHAEIPDIARQPADHPWLSQSNVPVVLSVGKLKPQKDFATLLRAFAKVRQTRAAKLVILGEGSERDGLRGLAKNLGIDSDVDLPGYVRNPFAFYSRASVFVLSSAWEGLPNVLIEAMSCGCPVVSTDCPSGPSEILEDGVVGKLVPVGDAEQMSQAILDTLHDAPARETLIERAKVFSVDEAVMQYERVLAGLA